MKKRKITTKKTTDITMTTVSADLLLSQLNSRRRRISDFSLLGRFLRLGLIVAHHGCEILPEALKSPRRLFSVA